MYTGIEEVVLSEKEIADFYERKLNIKLLPNQYLILKNEEDKIIDKIFFDGEKQRTVKPKKFNSGFDGDIKPLNAEQECMFDLLDNDNVPVKLISGNWGSGKSFVSLCWALGQIPKKYKKLVFVRNNYEVEGTKEIGFLKGSAEEKLLPFALPLGDIMGGEFILSRYMQEGKIELAHMGWLRSRTFDDSIIFVNEAQNLSSNHIPLLLSRVGKNSVIIFDGDTRQIDSKVFRNDSGLDALSDKLKGNELFGAIQLKTTVRSKVASLAELFN